MKSSMKMLMGSSVAAAVLILSGCSSDSDDTSTSFSYTVSPGEVVFDGNSAGVGAIKDVKVSADGGTLYAGTSDVAAGLVIIDLAANTFDIINTGDYGRAVELSLDGNTAYVAGTNVGTFTYVNLADNSIGTILNLNNPTDFVITKDGSTAYTGDGSDVFSKIDLANESNTTIDMNTGNGWWIPTVALSADETTLYLASSNFVSYNLNDDNFTQITTSTGIGVHGFNVSSDDTKAYVTTGPELEILDLSTNAVKTVITDINATNIFGNVKAVKLTADGRRLFAADTNYDDALFMVNLENNNSVSMIMNEGNVTCGLPDSIEISPNGSKVYLGCQNGVIASFNVQ